MDNDIKLAKHSEILEEYLKAISELDAAIQHDMEIGSLTSEGRSIKAILAHKQAVINYCDSCNNLYGYEPYLLRESVSGKEE